MTIHDHFNGSLQYAFQRIGINLDEWIKRAESLR